MREKHKISVGDTIKIVNYKKYTDKDGRNYWKSCYGLVQMINGKPINYEYIYFKSYQMGNLKDGDYVIIDKILSYHSSYAYNSNGGKSIFRTLEIEYVKMEKEDEE